MKFSDLTNKDFVIVNITVKGNFAIGIYLKMCNSLALVVCKNRTYKLPLSKFITLNTEQINAIRDLDLEFNKPYPLTDFFN